MKPRLRLVAYGSYLVAIAVVLLTYFGQIWAICALDLCPDSTWVFMVAMLLPILAFWLTLVAARALCLRFGWLSSDEAASFPFRQASRWPDTWLEEIDDRGVK